MEEQSAMGKIEDYLSNLTFEKTFMGVSQAAVYECLKTLSGMYEDVIQNMEKNQKKEIHKLKEMLEVKNSQIEQLQKNAAANGKPKKHGEETTKSLERKKKEYEEKAELLVKSITEIQKEREEHRRKTEQECSQMLLQAQEQSEQIKKEAQRQANLEYKKATEAMKNLDQARMNLKSGLQVIISELSEIMTDESKWQQQVEESLPEKDSVGA